MNMRRRVLQLDARDNVLVALCDLHKGETVEWSGPLITLTSDVPGKHKFATQDLPVGANVIMYGVPVGETTERVCRGERLTSRNLRHHAAGFREKSQEYRWTPPDVTKWKQREFLGYRRTDGQVGTRNYWLVVPLVFCENQNILNLKQAMEEELGFAAPGVYRSEVAELVRHYRESGRVKKVDETNAAGALARTTAAPIFANVDGIKFLLHEGGCGGTREDANNLCGLIAGYIHHPNVAGATVLSLGCQNAQVAVLREKLHKRNPRLDKPVVLLEQQEIGSEAAMLSRAIRETFAGLIQADSARRIAAPLSQLCVGLKCGGSDGFSGISANPAIGHTSDLLAALGAKTILSEFPELCGVEQELIDRAATKEIGNRFIQLMSEYAKRARAVGASLDMNPSPGNIRDGLLTDAMKSAGAVRKGGTSPVTAVLAYPEYSTQTGLNVQCTPGNDVECVTAQVGAGANVVLFTTGLGTPTGNPITPVVKLSTNAALAGRMADIIDIDTSGIITGESTVEEMGERVLELVIQVASGTVRTKAELNRQEDFIPWKRAVSL
jgi:altronate hydrolase